ncbi:MAG: hypothetical protein KDK72_09350 [Chlamydiia bacterium]|nr:hypothetical protein [Chlamydiia bacterium]
MSESLHKYHSIGALLLASSVKDLFPKITLLGNGEDRAGFFHDFAPGEQVIDMHALKNLEDRMLLVQRQGVDINIMEMLRVNAAAFLSSRKEEFLASQVLDSDESLVNVIQIGDNVDCVNLSDPELLKEIKAVKLTKVEDVSSLYDGRSAIRIRGVVASDRKLLKNYLKMIGALSEFDHRKLLSLQGLAEFLSDGVTYAWVDQGVKLLEILHHFAARDIEKQKFRVVAASLHQRDGFHELHRNLYKKFGNLPLPVKFWQYGVVSAREERGKLEGLFASQSCFIDQQTLFCGKEGVLEAVISSLQFIFKTVKILGFESQWHLCIPKQYKENKAASAIKTLTQAFDDLDIEYIVDENSNRFMFPTASLALKDVYGNSWHGPYVGLDKQVICCSTLGSHDRLIAMLIEKHKGVLPFWLVPEQVRILPLNCEVHSYAGNVRRELEKIGLRTCTDTSDDTLAKRVHRAKLAQVPLVIVIGDREKMDGTICLRGCDDDKEKNMQLNEFLQQMTQKIQEKGNWLEN